MKKATRPDLLSAATTTGLLALSLYGFIEVEIAFGLLMLALASGPIFLSFAIQKVNHTDRLQVFFLFMLLLGFVDAIVAIYLCIDPQRRPLGVLLLIGAAIGFLFLANAYRKDKRGDYDHLR